MSAPSARKILLFSENKYKFLKLYSLGYNDCKIHSPTGLYQVNRWNALYYVRNGNCKFSIYGKTYSLSKGDLFFIPTNVPVQLNPDSEGGFAYYWIAFYPDYAGEISEVLGFCESTPARAAKFPQRVEWIFDTLMEAKTATTEVYFAAMSALMQILSIEYSNAGVSKSTRRHKELAENVKRVIDYNFANEDFTLNDVAQMLFVSHAQMSRVFKEVMGITPVAYLIDVRLNRAAQLLSEDDFSVKELRCAVGFSDEVHLMKQFKKKFGVTVKEYRKQHIED